MSKRKKLSMMVDMDEVLTFGGVEKIISDFLGIYIDPHAPKSYFLQDLLGDRKEEFMKIFGDMNHYEYCEIIPWAQEALEELNMYYDIYITTSYIWKEIPEKAGINLMNKYNILIEKFPFLDPYKFIFVGDKINTLKFDIRIDDRITNLRGDDSTKLLFPAYHNFNVTQCELDYFGVKQVSGWQEILRFLLPIKND